MIRCFICRRPLVHAALMLPATRTLPARSVGPVCARALGMVTGKVRRIALDRGETDPRQMELLEAHPP